MTEAVATTRLTSNGDERYFASLDVAGALDKFFYRPAHIGSANRQSAAMIRNAAPPARKQQAGKGTDSVARRLPLSGYRGYDADNRVRFVPLKQSSSQQSLPPLRRTTSWTNARTRA